MGSARGVKPSPRVDPAQFNRMTSVCCQLLQIKQLGAAITFTKGMDVVHVAHNFARRRGESRSAQIAKVITGGKPAMNIGHPRLDIASELELLLVFRDLHAADLAGPFVHVLEQMPMDGAKMGEVEVSGR